MVDFLRNNIDRIMRTENSKVRELNKSTVVSKYGKNDKNRESFKEKLKKVQIQKKGEIEEVESTKEQELLESNIIVDSSLTKQLEQNRKITELVKEKFVDNPSLKNSIDFKDDDID